MHPPIMMMNNDISIDSDIEPSESSFDPAFLLTEPLMDDDDMSLLRQAMSNQTVQPQGVMQQQLLLQQQQQLLQQQLQSSQQSFSSFNNNNNNYLSGSQEHFAPLKDSSAQLEEAKTAVTIRMEALQKQINQVQQQIQHVQLQSTQLDLQSSQSQTPNQQEFQNVPRMISDSSMGGPLRLPPNRSLSNPLMQRPRLSEAIFAQQAQPPTLQAMAASLQGSQMNDSGNSATMMQGFSTGMQGSQGQSAPGNVNEAMEKLCESMRRSAMSRSLVKQLSGSGTISRSRSGGLSRGVGRSNSGGLSRSLSGSDSVRPIRRIPQDSKHRIQRDSLSNSGGPPRRGVFRNKSSQGALGGQTRMF